MKDILEEIKGSMGGVIGSFVIGGAGNVIAQDVPGIMEGSIDKVSKTIFHVGNVIKDSKNLEKMTVDSESAKLIAIDIDGRTLVVVAEKTLNLPLFKLMSNMAISKIKATPLEEDKAAEPVEEEKKQGPVATDEEIEKIGDVYDRIYSQIAKRLFTILGPRAAHIFNEKMLKVRTEHPDLLGGVSIEKNGKPTVDKLVKNAKEVSKEDLLIGLDALASSMIEAVKTNAGPKIAEKAEKEFLWLKEENKEDL